MNRMAFRICMSSVAKAAVDIRPMILTGRRTTSETGASGSATRFSISSADYLSMFGSVDNLKKTASIHLQLSDGKDYPTEGKVELINNEANKMTDAIQVYATFPNQDFKLLVGSTVRVTLTKKQAKKVPAIAPSAVMYDSRGAFVYVVGKKSKVEKRYVIPGNSTPDWQLVRAGLKLGETVIVQGTHKTMPGATVEPRSAGKKK